jgi:hypothetical protein
VSEGFAPLKVLGYTPGAQILIEKAGIGAHLDEGVIELNSDADIKLFISAAKKHRIWAREGKLG